MQPGARPDRSASARRTPTCSITGEHGTGKDVSRSALHAVSSRARHGRWSPSTSGGLSEGVFESELFGHVKGAFTDAKADRVGRFELADGGTLFLDEIANVPLTSRQAPARARDRRVRARRARRARGGSTCGSSRPPTPTCAPRWRPGRFRAGPAVPPQHDRDPPAAAARAARGHPAAGARTSCASTPRATARARRVRRRGAAGAVAHPWPGNVRELDHAVERAVLMAQGERDRARPTSGCGAARRRAAALEEMSLEEVERLLIQKALERYDGNVSRAAEPRPLAAARSTGGSSSTGYDAGAVTAHATRRLAHERRILLAGARCRAAPPLVLALVLLWRATPADAALDARRRDRRRGLARLRLSLRGAASSGRCRRSRTCSRRCARATSRSARAAARARRRARRGAARGQRARRDPARAAPRRAGGDGAAAQGDGGDRRRGLRVRRRATAPAREPRRERLLGAPAERAARADRRRARARPTASTGEPPRIVGRAFPGRRRPLGAAARHASGRTGRRTSCSSLTDLSRALRDEERQAWQRLIRVLGHELNNSLAPIKSIAGSLERSARREPRPADWRGRPAARPRGHRARGPRRSSRFMEAYARARPAARSRSLGAGRRGRPGCGAWPRSRRARAGRGRGRARRSRSRPTATSSTRLLINLVRNAVDAALRDRRRRARRLDASTGALRSRSRVEDDGPGLASTANLFVPFFTTKPGGSGIGLVLSPPDRRGARRHAEPREPPEGGCRAPLRLQR